MSVLVFDVNETLLDLSVLRPGFDGAFGDGEAAMREWFLSLLHASGVSNELRRYRPFGELGAQALRAVAKRRGVDLDEAGVAVLLRPFRSLPPHPDVREGLEMMRDFGCRMATLTNSAYDGLVDLLSNAGVAQFMEQMLSVDEVRRFKPAREVYEMAAERLDVGIGELTMIAAHDWDLMGAKAAGASTAFVARPGAVWTYPDVQPDFEGGDLVEVASQIIADLG